MDKNQLLIELEKNLKEFNSIEEKKSMITLAIYEKQINELKTQKIQEVQNYLSNQVNFYEQDIKDYKENINLTVKKYTEEIDKLIKSYDYLYIKIFKNRQEAVNNQTMITGNVIQLVENKQNKKDAELKKINNQIIALLQKKVNYSVIVEECNARLNWCIESFEKDIQEVFENKFYQIELYKGSFFEKLRRKILNIFSGKKKLLEILNNYKKENLKQISDNNDIKVINIISITTGILKQLQNVEEQINSQYNEAIS